MQRDPGDIASDPGADGPPWPICPDCGYDLTGLTVQRCPECGMAFTADTLGSPETMRRFIRRGLRAASAGAILALLATPALLLWNWAFALVALVVVALPIGVGALGAFAARGPWRGAVFVLWLRSVWKLHLAWVTTILLQLTDADFVLGGHRLLYEVIWPAVTAGLTVALALPWSRCWRRSAAIAGLPPSIGRKTLLGPAILVLLISLSFAYLLFPSVCC